MRNRAHTDMNEVFQAGRAGVERCWCPTCVARELVLFFFLQLSLLSDPLLVGALPEPTPSYPEAGHMPFALSECACHRRKRCGDKSAPGLCRRIYKFLLCTKKGAFLRGFCAVHLCICWKKRHDVRSSSTAQRVATIYRCQLLPHLKLNAYLCIHTWGLRSIPSLVRRQKALACHLHMSCHRCYQNLPWSSCLHTSQLCGREAHMKVKDVQSFEFRENIYGSPCIPNKTSFRPVDQMPSVGGEVFPSDILRVMPESADLVHERTCSSELIFNSNTPDHMLKSTHSVI